MGWPSGYPTRRTLETVVLVPVPCLEAPPTPSRRKASLIRRAPCPSKCSPCALNSLRNRGNWPRPMLLISSPLHASGRSPTSTASLYCHHLAASYHRAALRRRSAGRSAARYSTFSPALSAPAAPVHCALGVASTREHQRPPSGLDRQRTAETTARRTAGPPIAADSGSQSIRRRADGGATGARSRRVIMVASSQWGRLPAIASRQ